MCACRVRVECPFMLAKAAAKRIVTEINAFLGQHQTETGFALDVCHRLVYEDHSVCSMTSDESGRAELTQLDVDRASVTVRLRASVADMPHIMLDFVVSLDRGSLVPNSVVQMTRYAPHMACAPKNRHTHIHTYIHAQTHTHPTRYVQKMCYCNTSDVPVLLVPDEVES